MIECYFKSAVDKRSAADFWRPLLFYLSSTGNKLTTVVLTIYVLYCRWYQVLSSYLLLGGSVSVTRPSYVRTNTVQSIVMKMYFTVFNINAEQLL